MPIAAIRVLMINPRIDFAVAIKQALEDTGLFEVYPFTSADTALDFLRQNAQDIALVDFSSPSLQPENVVQQLRSVQQGIALIGHPLAFDAVLARRLAIHATIDVPFTAREIIPLIQSAIREQLEALPDTAETTQLPEDEATTLRIARKPPNLPEFSSLDSIVLKMGGFDSDSQRLDTPAVVPDELQQSDTEEQESRRTFERLAAEEPPMPTLDESGTLADLRLGVTNTHFAEVLRILQRDEAVRRAPQIPDADASHETPIFQPQQDIEQTTAQVILRAAEDTLANDSAALDEMLSNIATQLPPNTRAVQPLPSWIERESALEEPIFLRNLMPEGYTNGQTTRPSSRQKVVDKPGDLETDRIAPRRPIPPPPTRLPEEKRPPAASKPPLPEQKQPPAPIKPPLPEVSTAAESDTGLLNRTEVIELQTDFYRLAAFELPSEVIKAREATAAIAQASEPAAPSANIPAAPASTDLDINEQLIAQLAVSLTQASLDLTAEATLLARNGQIVAYAGNLPQTDLDEMRAALNGDWEATNQEGMRIRFVTLASNGKDYMLYSRLTIEGYTLTMVFDSTTPLTDIRRQGKALMDALIAPPPTALPEIPPPARLPEPMALLEAALPDEPAEIVPIDVGPLLPYAFVWLLADPAQRLAKTQQKAVEQGLRRLLPAQGWRINTLHVDEDYVYLLTDVPGARPANEIIRELQQRSGELIDASSANRLWSDSYLVITPGRALDLEEIQQFISFARM